MELSECEGYPVDHVLVDVVHLVVGEVQALEGGVAEDAVFDGGDVVKVLVSASQKPFFPFRSRVY